MIVGASFRDGFYFYPRAVRWQGTFSPPTDLGTLPGGYHAVARAINLPGVIVGWSDIGIDAPKFAAAWVDGQVNNLGALPGDIESSAQAINRHGVIVGNSTRIKTGLTHDIECESRAVVWPIRRPLRRSTSTGWPMARDAPR